jgi:hypothetical protein
VFNFKWLRRLTARRAVTPPAPAQPQAAGFELIFGQQATKSSRTAVEIDTVAIVGNCLSETMAAGLALVLTASNFKFVAIPLHLRSLDDEDAQRTIRAARHVFIQGCVAHHTETIRAAAPAHCQFIFYPDLVLRSLWPFDEHSAPRDPAVDANPNAVIHHHDAALAKLRETEPDKKKRFQRYRDLEFERAGTIDRVIQAQQRFLESIDRGSDAFFGRFIARHYKDRQLFYDSVHPSAVMFQELCEFCWRKLELKGQPPLIPGMDGWKEWSVPVHPLVARRLGLKWASETTRYNYGPLGAVTWNEWVHTYIDTFG